jgi:hypothetical protein
MVPPAMNSMSSAWATITRTVLGIVHVTFPVILSPPEADEESRDGSEKAKKNEILRRCAPQNDRLVGVDDDNEDGLGSIRHRLLPRGSRALSDFTTANLRRVCRIGPGRQYNQRTPFRTWSR